MNKGNDMIFNIVVHGLKTLVVIVGMMMAQRAVHHYGTVAVSVAVGMTVAAAAAAMVLFVVHAHSRSLTLNCRRKHP